MLLVLLALVLVLARLYDVQVREHEVWATEAAALQRSETTLPFRRGGIYDRKGRSWVRDEVRYELEFVWRDFRRGHPLGNLAQLRSLLALKPVSLQEAVQDRSIWAQALVALTPQGISDFAKGERIEGGSGLSVAALPQEGRRDLARAERRGARAAAVHFYLQRLLDVSNRESRDLRDLRKNEGRELPYLTLVAMVRRGSGEDLGEALQRERRRLHDRIDESLDRLTQLAEAVDWADIKDDSPRAMLLELLEGVRTQAADAAADRLFSTAAGFRPGRLSKSNLQRLDLDWLRRCVYWDTDRLQQWIEGRGEGWGREVKRVLAGHVFARMRLFARMRQKSERSAADSVLDALAYFFVDPSERPILGTRHEGFWQEFRKLEVLAELPYALEHGDQLRAADLRQVLPLEVLAMRRSELPGAVLIAKALSGMQQADQNEAWINSGRVRLQADHLLNLAQRSGSDWQSGELDPIEDVLMAWDDRLQMRLGGLLKELPQPVTFATGRLRAALEARDHVVKDMDARARSFTRKPSLELVHLVERHREHYAGFSVRSVTDRVPVALSKWATSTPENGTPVKRLVGTDIVGQVRAPQLESLLEQVADLREVRRLKRQLELDPEERERLYGFIEASYHPDQSVGSTGIEGYLDPELTGTNGYRELVGLEEQRGQGRAALYRLPVDGQDVELTLDLELQRWAEWVINHPEPAPKSDKKPDDAWVANPVGAIVLMKVTGEVLAAASAPLMPGLKAGGADGQALKVLERTMRQPVFHPPGSIFKPFVAAFALEHLGLDPDEKRVACSGVTQNKSKSGAGWGHMACHSYVGHTKAEFARSGRTDITLQRAIKVSCNTYFAQLGETLFDEDDFLELFRVFGIGKRTGVRFFGEDKPRRGGLREDWEHKTSLSYSVVERQRLANGLSHISTTPMAMARGYAGLASGQLPGVRLVQAIDGRVVPTQRVPLGISERNLDIVRRSMRAVVEASGGSANGKRLDAKSLGFSFVCKTGSADIGPGLVPDYGNEQYVPSGQQERVMGTRKHTWIAGWFPAENPRYVALFYLHDTATTSGHGAVYLAEQFLSGHLLDALLEEAE